MQGEHLGWFQELPRVHSEGRLPPQSTLWHGASRRPTLSNSFDKVVGDFVRFLVVSDQPALQTGAIGDSGSGQPLPFS